MRRFALRNSVGEFFDLMRTDAFFADPSGLGFSKSNEYLQVGSSFLITKEELEQGSISGTMYFASQSAYKEFVTFISKEPLILFQDPDGSNFVGSIPEQLPVDERPNWWNRTMLSYYRLDGRFTSVDKSDTNHDISYLECSVTFAAESSWYISKRFYTEKENMDLLKYYNPRYNNTYTYDYRYTNGTSSSIYISMNGTEDSPTDIKIYGPITNPTWELRSNNKVVSKGSAVLDVPDGAYLNINSRNGHLAIEVRNELTDELIQNAYECIDFDKDNFIIIPKSIYKDTQYTLRVNGLTSDINVKCDIELEETYETV